MALSIQCYGVIDLSHRLGGRIGVMNRRMPLALRASLFDSFFQGKPSHGKSKGKDPAEKKRLVSEMLMATTKSRLVQPDRETQEKVQRLAYDLGSFGKDGNSSSIEGSWEISYSSNPSLFPLTNGPAGSPLTLAETSPLPIEQFQRVGNVLVYSMSIEVKTLGFINGSYETRGAVDVISDEAYEIDLNETLYRNGLGSTVTKRIRDFLATKVLYIDEAIKVASTRISTNEDDEECLVVSVRKQDNVLGTLSTQSRARKPSASSLSSNVMPAFFGRPKTTSGFATRSERLALRKIEQDSQKKGQKQRQQPPPSSISPAEAQKRQEEVKVRVRAKESERKDNQVKIVRALREADEERARLSKEKALSQPSQQELAEAKSMLEIASEILRRAMGEKKDL